MKFEIRTILVELSKPQALQTYLSKTLALGRMGFQAKLIKLEILTISRIAKTSGKNEALS